MFVPIIQIVSRNKIYLLSILLIPFISGCWFESLEPGPPKKLDATKGIVLKSNSPNTVAAGEPIHAEIKLTKLAKYKIELEDIFGVCFTVDGVSGGLCANESPPTPLPPCISLTNNSTVSKDLGKYILEPGIEKVFTHHLTFTCNKSKTVVVTAILYTPFLSPLEYFNYQWRYQRIGNSITFRFTGK